MSIVEKRNQEMQQMHHPCTAERRPMLELRDVSFRYKGRHSDTLRHVGLSLESGEMLLLAGRSGCGKSTLIKVISGLVSGEGQERREGTVLWNGEDMADWPPEKIGLLAGTVYQTPDDQLFAMTVEDEAGFALENQGEAPEAVHDQVEEILGLTGLAGLEKRGIHQLSGGQRQRMALASVLIGKPRLLILDEPVSQMDPRGVQDFMELLLRLNREEGIAILMIEHRVNELACYFHRLAIMREGRIVYDGPLQAAWAFLTYMLCTAKGQNDMFAAVDYFPAYEPAWPQAPELYTDGDPYFGGQAPNALAAKIASEVPAVYNTIMDTTAEGYIYSAFNAGAEAGETAEQIRERLGKDIEVACAELKLQQIQNLKDAGVWQE